MLTMSIVIATRNRGDKIRATIESTLANTSQDFELMIIDQSTNPDTCETVKPFLADPRIHYRLIDIAGTSNARNMAIDESNGEIIVITDDDCILPRNYLEMMSLPFEKHLQVGVVFCSVEPVEKTRGDGYTPQYHISEEQIIHNSREAFKGFGKGLGLGAGMAVRRSVIEEIGGFDEALGPGSVFPSAEDKDVAMRALMRGWFILETPDIAVLHDGFRPMVEVSELTKRDLYGAGGTYAKFLKCGHFEIIPLIITWAYMMGIRGPLVHLIHLKGPRGVKRLFNFTRGLFNGLRTPVDRNTIAYRPRVFSKHSVVSTN